MKYTEQTAAPEENYTANDGENFGTYFQDDQVSSPTARANVGNMFQNGLPGRRQATLEAMQLAADSDSQNLASAFSYNINNLLNHSKKEEEEKEKKRKTPRWKDLNNTRFSLTIKAIATQIHFQETEGYLAFTLSPSKQLLNQAKRSERGITHFFSKRISAALQRHCIAPEFWFCLEVYSRMFDKEPRSFNKRTKRTKPKEHHRLHIHGAVKLHPIYKDNLTKALRLALKYRATKAMTPRGEDVDVRANPYPETPIKGAVEWATYSCKALGYPRFMRRNGCAPELDHLAGQPEFYCSNNARNGAESVYKALTQAPSPTPKEETSNTAHEIPSSILCTNPLTGKPMLISQKEVTNESIKRTRRTPLPEPPMTEEQLSELLDSIDDTQ